MIDDRDINFDFVIDSMIDLMIDSMIKKNEDDVSNDFNSDENFDVIFLSSIFSKFMKISKFFKRFKIKKAFAFFSFSKMIFYLLNVKIMYDEIIIVFESSQSQKLIDSFVTKKFFLMSYIYEMRCKVMNHASS